MIITSTGGGRGKAEARGHTPDWCFAQVCGARPDDWRAVRVPGEGRQRCGHKRELAGVRRHQSPGRPQ